MEACRNKKNVARKQESVWISAVSAAVSRRLWRTNLPDQWDCGTEACDATVPITDEQLVFQKRMLSSFLEGNGNIGNLRVFVKKT